MESKLITLCTILAITIASVSAGCSVSDVTSFTTQDATIVAQIAYIGEFTLKCDGNQSPQIFAEVEGKVTPISKVGTDRYQISWSTEIKKARSGDVIVRLFDEDGYGNLKKAQRNGECLSTVKSFAEIAVNHAGAYTGALVNSEYVATVLGVLATYFAIYNRKTITA